MTVDVVVKLMPKIPFTCILRYLVGFSCTICFVYADLSPDQKSRLEQILFALGLEEACMFRAEKVILWARGASNLSSMFPLP
jgi:hypothetical protein